MSTIYYKTVCNLYILKVSVNIPFKDILMKKFFCLLFLLCGIQSYGADIHYFGQTPDDIVSKINYGNNQDAGHYVQSADAKIHYEIYGKGEPVLILHGGGIGCTYEMGRFADKLSEENFMIIAPSTRGHGKSETGSKTITYEQKANDMMAAVNKTTKKRIIILGFSDGAYTAYKIASMYPDRVKKIIAIGAGELDKNAPLDTVINAYKMIPNAQLAIIANSPHQCFITNFDAVWSNIIPFLKD